MPAKQSSEVVLQWRPLCQLNADITPPTQLGFVHHTEEHMGGMGNSKNTVIAVVLKNAEPIVTTKTCPRRCYFQYAHATRCHVLTHKPYKSVCQPSHSRLLTTSQRPDSYTFAPSSIACCSSIHVHLRFLPVRNNQVYSCYEHLFLACQHMRHISCDAPVCYITSVTVTTLDT